MRSFLALAAFVVGCGGSSGGAPDAMPAAPDAGVPVDPAILAAEVDESRLLGSILELQDFGTRYTFSEGDEAAAGWLVGELEALGLDVERDAFTVGETQAENIIARLPGTVTPEVVYIFSAHYDSTSGSAMTDAPGADDNASGVAGVLEAARILSAREFESSIWFVFTAAEEQGSLGSAHMVTWLAADEIDVRGVIAPDMIGYWPLGDDDLFDILGDEDSEWLVDEMAAWATNLGVAHKKFINHGYCYGDDHTNFQEQGFPAITPMDCVEAHNVVGSGESTPHYHQTSDRVETLHMPFTARVVGVIVATLAALAEPHI